MERGKANEENLMSFSSDEEDNGEVQSKTSWLTTLSELNTGSRSCSGSESTRSLSPNFWLLDVHERKTGENSIRLPEMDMHISTTGQHASWADFTGNFAMEQASLFHQKRDLRISHSCSDLSPPRSPTKKATDISPSHPTVFSNYHQLSRPSSYAFDSKTVVSSDILNANDLSCARVVKETGSGVTHGLESHTSSLFVTLSRSGVNQDFQRASSCLGNTLSSSSFHPYGSITLKPKSHSDELCTGAVNKGVISCESLHGDESVFQTELLNEGDCSTTWAEDPMLQVQLPAEEGQPHKGTAVRPNSVPPPRSLTPKISKRFHSTSLPNKNSNFTSTARESRHSSKKFLFFGDGLFDVAKERNEEAIEFSKMIAELRGNFHWHDATNPGYVVSPTVPYDHEAFPLGTETTLAIYTEERQDTLRFSFNIHCPISRIIELALNCFIDGSGIVNDSTVSAYVLKVCGRSEYLRANSLLVQYGYVQECLKLQREVELVLLGSWQVSSQLARTEEDDQVDTVPQYYKEFFDCHSGTAISKYGLSVLMEAFDDELIKLLEETTDPEKPRFEPSRVIQSVKAICATLATLETQDVIASVAKLKDLQTSDECYHVHGRKVPYQEELNSALSKLSSAVLFLIEMYCDAFDTDFIPMGIDRPKLGGSIEVTAMSDNVRIHVAFAHRLPLQWNHDFEYFEVQSGIYYGGRLLCPVEVTPQVETAKHFFAHLQWIQWLQFKIQVRQLPRESRLCLTLYGVSQANKGNAVNSIRTPLGWAAVQLFNFQGILVSGTHLLGLWPYDKANPLGTCTSNLLHPMSVILQVEFERYLADIVFPDFKETTWMHCDGTDRCVPQSTARDVYKHILEKDLFNELKPMESELLWEHRQYCMSNPKALPLILSAAPSWEYQCLPDIYSLLAGWAPMRPVDAMELLKLTFPDIRVRATAVQWMEGFGDDELCDYLPQLVQALKYENYHDSLLVRFLVCRALASVRVMHYLFWYLKDTINEPQFGQRFQIVLGGLLSICGQALRTEFIVQDQITSVVAKVAQKVQSAKDYSRQTVLQQELTEVAAFFSSSVRLPVSPSFEVKGLDLQACGYFTSNSAPLRLIFKNVDAFGDDVHVMFKIGDDMRQDRLIMQLVGIMNKIWLREGVDLKMITYKCIATGRGMGMVEIVKEAVTLREIHTELGLAGSFKDEPIARWIQKYNTGLESYQQAVDNFTASCAGFCVATYVLGICDRHNDNIMIHRSGHLFHIDFAKILGNSQMFGSFRRDRAPFVLTPDMAFVINGGYEPSSRFQDFVDLCCKAFNVIRRHSNLILNLLSLMLNSGISCLRQVTDLKYIRDCLLLDASEGEATAAFTRLIECSLSSWFTQMNFFIHNVAQIREVGQLKRSLSTDGKPNSLLSFVQARYSVDSDGVVESARVVDFQKRYNREKYYIYVINICRVGIETPTFVFRRFSHFHELQSKLSEAFPEVNLPRLPSKIYLGRSQIRVVAERRRAELDDYIRLLLMMQPEVSESDLLYTFLHPVQQDHREASLFSIRLLPEEKRNRERVIGGQIKLLVRHEREALRVMIMHAKDLSPRSAASLADPYVKLYLLPDSIKATKLKTKIARRTLNPTFNETLVYGKSEREVRERVLQVTVWDHDYVGENEFLGGLLIDLLTADLRKSVGQWYTLTDIRKQL